ncbi:MAG TPA: TOPRIM nucleotidyl transferase/hydrolase domain-containing protein [Thermomicrobiaceae bacterium]|nr:TOPRIM nucleotidyl transferase/hydrolase domain-containing protein [Thermomicrobiaceae bacterium]
MSEHLPRAVVLVEGLSDRAALETLAERRGWDLAARDVSIVPMGGAQALARYLELLGPRGPHVRVSGLCDAHEERDFRRALERTGLGSGLTRAEMEQRGFYVCVADLEDELIRALGTAVVEEIIDAQGELGAFRTFQRQPAQRPRSVEAQLRRFMGTRSGRKIHYARVLVAALEIGRVPRPLDRVLSYVWD